MDKKNKNFASRFGYLMVAAGASIGLGNIWKFPYLAYRGGGGHRPLQKENLTKSNLTNRCALWFNKSTCAKTTTVLL